MIRCTIVTPAGAVYDGEVRYASFPAWDGQLGVMAGQSPILTRLGIGGMRLDLPDGSSRWYHLSGGFAQVREGAITVLTERAARAEDLSLAEAERMLREANARVTAGGTDPDEVRAEQERARTMRAMAVARGAG